MAAMRPLQSIAMGLVIVALQAPVAGGYDALPDPVGWLLVILGTHRLPADVPRHDTLSTLAWVAGAVSVALWFPAVPEAAYDTNPSLGWALNLPQLGYAGLLCHSLATSAVAAEDGRAAAWLRTAMVGFVAAAVLPVLVFGGGVGSLQNMMEFVAAMVLLTVILLLFAYSARPWAVD